MLCREISSVRSELRVYAVDDCGRRCLGQSTPCCFDAAIHVLLPLRHLIVFLQRDLLDCMRLPPRIAEMTRRRNMLRSPVDTRLSRILDHLLSHGDQVPHRRMLTAGLEVADSEGCLAVNSILVTPNSHVNAATGIHISTLSWRIVIGIQESILKELIGVEGLVWGSSFEICTQCLSNPGLPNCSPYSNSLASLINATFPRFLSLIIPNAHEQKHRQKESAGGVLMSIFLPVRMIVKVNCSNAAMEC